MRTDPRLSVVRRAACWAGINLARPQQDQLMALGAWLVEEALPAGGIGPSEAPVVHSRHIADSLLFAGAWERPDPPSSLLDVGAGVGLPGIPLAIAWPTADVVLLDRSSRRADLARRALRVLGLDNVRVAAIDSREWTARSDLVVCRGVGPPDSLRGELSRLTARSGAAVVGGSHRDRPRASGYRVREVPESIIGHPVWLLSMDRT